MAAAILRTLPELSELHDVVLAVIRDCFATEDRGTIKVHGKGWIDLQLVYGNPQIGELETREDFPITYSAEFAKDRAVLSCRAIANTDAFYGRDKEDVESQPS